MSMKKLMKDIPWLNVIDTHGIKRIEKIRAFTYSTLMVISFAFAILFVVLALLLVSQVYFVSAMIYLGVGVAAILAFSHITRGSKNEPNRNRERANYP